MVRYSLIVAKLIAVAVFIYYYHNYNPEHHDLFPKCIFLQLSGFKCPGCGSQRAIHHILNGNFKIAWQMNALLITMLPFITAGLFLNTYKGNNATLMNIKKMFFKSSVIYLILIVILIFWVARNISLINS